MVIAVCANRMPIVLIAMALWMFSGRAVHADGICPLGAKGYLLVSRVLIPDGWPPTWSPRCPDEECRAKKDVLCTIDAMLGRDVPNSHAYLSPAGRDAHQRDYARVYNAFGRAHPERRPLYCSLLRRVASRASGTREADENTVMTISEMAVRLDRPRFRCSTQVMAAFPRTEAMRAEIDRARLLCWAEPRRLCRRIRAVPP